MTESPKAAVRREVRSRLAAMAAERQRSEAGALAAFLETWATARGFTTVLATLPLPGEPDLTGFLSSWLARGGRAALARTGPGRSLEFHGVANLEGPWEPGPLGLKEPRRDAPLWTPGEPTLALVPGLAFAPGPGGAVRLGRGGGYYDRWLALHGGQVFTLGVGFSVQTVEALPVEPHDAPLDAWWDGAKIRT